MSARLRRLKTALLLAGTAAACRDNHDAANAPVASPPDAAPPWSASERAPTPPQGMIWVPEGALIAGTPPDRVPRIADEEMPGLQVMLQGFFMDMYAYPNEEGAIPQTGASHARAESLCAERGKRLCTELEWERACKGPRNQTYEYGDVYRADACGTGKTPRMLPNGYRQACRSEFGARDMHGGVWEWTASRWGRGTTGDQYSLRGGNGPLGDVVGRCANAMPRPAETSSPQIGFRCCKGPANSAAVSLRVVRGRPIEARPRGDGNAARLLEGLVPEEARAALNGYGQWHVSNLWTWRPTGNVELTVATGCAGEPPAARCSALVAQLGAGAPLPLGWAWAGVFAPVPKVKTEARQLWLYSSDRRSNLRQAIWYEWGRTRVGELQRRFPPSLIWQPAEPNPAREPPRGFGLRPDKAGQGRRSDPANDDLIEPD